jgi:hypothetical protein
VAGYLVLGRGDALPVRPRHQANPGRRRQRQVRQVARQRESQGKQPGRQATAAQQTDRWVALFTSHPTWLDASRSYTHRWTTAGSYRDAQGGYAGQHGWDLEPTVAREPEAHVVDSLLGLWALGSCLQTTRGDRLSHRDVAPAVRDARARWTPTDRLSGWLRGRFALTDPVGDLRPHLLTSLHATARQLHGSLTAPPPPRELLHAA